MSDIYDRSAWPSPEENPLVLLVKCKEEWFPNEQVVAALGLAPGRALLSNGTVFKRQIRDEDAAIVSRGWLVPSKNVNRSNSGQMRLLSRRAVIIAAMRTETVNAAAFRDWMADRLCEAV